MLTWIPTEPSNVDRAQSICPREWKAYEESTGEYVGRCLVVRYNALDGKIAEHWAALRPFRGTIAEGTLDRCSKAMLESFFTHAKTDPKEQK